MSLLVGMAGSLSSWLPGPSLHGGCWPLVGRLSNGRAGLGPQGVPGLVLACWWVELSPGDSDSSALEVLKLCQSTGGWGQIPGLLTKDPRVSHIWSWPLGRVKSRGLWLEGPEVSLLVLDLCWVRPIPDIAGCGVQHVPKLCLQLVNGARSWDSWLRVPRCLRAGAGLPVRGLGPAMAHCRAVVAGGLESIHWWMRPALKLELVLWSQDYSHRGV